MSNAMLHELKCAHADLQVAILQSLPSDDQIIMDRVRQAAETIAGVIDDCKKGSK